MFNIRLLKSCIAGDVMQSSRQRQLTSRFAGTNRISTAAKSSDAATTSSPTVNCPVLCLAHPITVGATNPASAPVELIHG